MELIKHNTTQKPMVKIKGTFYYEVFEHPHYECIFKHLKLQLEKTV